VCTESLLIIQILIVEALRVIAETIRVACETIGNHVPILNSKPSSQKQFFKPRIPNVASSLVNKYLVSNPQERGRYSDTSHGLPRSEYFLLKHHVSEPEP